MRCTAAVLLALLGTAGRAAAQADSVTTCVASGGGLALFRLAASDTVAFDDSVRRTDPASRPGYAAEQPWFTGYDPIPFSGQRLTKLGLPRFIEGHLLRRVGEHRGVGVYAAERDWWRVEVFYLPVRAGCKFQPYRTPHWGIPCSYLGCPFPREEAPPGAACRLRDGELVWERQAGDPRQEGPFAASRRWYAADRTITFQGRGYVKVGLPRRLPPGSVRRIGEVDGVGVYAGSPEYEGQSVYGFYVPVREGCEFQLYEDAEALYTVRGD
jgi:hypothetical protein